MTGPIEIVAPFGGLNENAAYDKQPVQTTSDCANVGPLDPETGRQRISKRPGRTRQHPDRLSLTEKVADLGSVTFTVKTVDYTQDEASLWTKSGFDCPWVETDADGNAYAITGPAAITKYSADGEIVYTFSVPVPQGGTVGTLDVDEGSNVYTGVSGTRSPYPAGTLGSPEPGNGLILGDMDDARLWKLQHAFRNNDEETEPELEVAWVLTTDEEDPGPTLHGLVTFVRSKGGKLYTLQQDNRQWRTWLVVYDQIHAGIPVEVFSRDDIPYPASMLDVDQKGRIVISSENFTRRGQNPAYPEAFASLVGWDPAKDIDQDVPSGGDKHQVYTHFKLEPQYLVTTGGLEPEDGSEVIEWHDASGHGRVLKFASTTGQLSALYREHGLGGMPELYFDGNTMLYVTGVSPSGDADFRDAGRGIFPTYKDPDNAERSSQYAAVMLMRPEAKTDGTTLTNQFPAWSHEVANSTLSDQSALLINRGIGATPALDTLSSANNNVVGGVSWYCRADASNKGEGSASGLMPAAIQPDGTNPFGGFNNAANALLVSVLACNGVDAGDADTKTRSLFRVWGKPVDRFMQEANVNYSVAEQFLGGSAHADFSSLGLYRGGISEIIVLDRKDLDTVGADSVCTHPAQPDATAGNVVGQVVIKNEGTGGTNITGNLTFTGGLGFGGISASGTWTSLDGKITTINMTSQGAGYTSQPTVTATGYTGAGAVLQAGMAYQMGTHGTKTVLEKIEGYLAWKFGVAHLLSANGSYRVTRVNSSGSKGTYTWRSAHPYFNAVFVAPFVVDQGPPENENGTKLYKFSHKGEVLTYLDPSGKILDVLSHELNGIGLGCRFNHDGTLIYTAGNTSGSDAQGTGIPANRAALRKIVVKDDDTLGWMPVDGGGAIFSALHMSGPRCGLKVDAADNVYVPCNAPADTGQAFTLAVVTPLGTLIHGFSLAAGIDNQGTYCVALPRAIEKADLEPFTNDYEGDLTDDIVENVWIAGKTKDYNFVELGDVAVRKYRLVVAAPNDNEPRSRVDLGIVAGGVVRFDTPTIEEPPGGGNIVGTGYVHSVSAFEKFYWTDGATDWLYDPKLDTVSPWIAKRGTMPPRCRVIELWRGRVVRIGDDGAVHMSRVFQPDDWDTHPPVPTVDQACDFSGTQVGNLPDRVTGFVPYADDLALIGGDHTLWRLDGDPMFGGRLSNVSTSIGMAFGRAWCIDGQSRIWFIDNQGQLQAMESPRATPQSPSEGKIARRLQQIDFSRYYMRLAYDRNRQGIWIMPLPFGDLEDEQIETFYYDMRTGSFWPHFIDDLQGQVTAMHVIDGDEPQDRRVLFGHGNGYVTYADDTTTRDDATAIRSRVLLGPFQAQGVGKEIRTLRMGMVLGSNQGGVTWNLYASATPDNKGTPKKSGTFGAGNNYLPSAKTLGAYFWIELLATTAHARFSYEKAWLTFEVAGDRQKVRP